MYAQNKTKKGKMAFSHLFRTKLAITISAMVSGRLGTMSTQKLKFFFIEHELHVKG